MDGNLMLGIYEGTVDIETLTEEQQEQLLRDYNTLAQHWAESTQNGYADLGKQILLLIEAAGVEIDESGDTLH